MKTFSLLALFLSVATLQAAVFQVSTTADSGAGSLRDAIIASNAAIPPSGTNNLITFALTPSGQGYNADTDSWVIQPLTPLPDITQPVTIDGYTQANAQPNTKKCGTNAVIKIEINGSFYQQLITPFSSVGAVVAFSNQHGLRLSGNSAGSTIRGLAITEFFGPAIRLLSGSNTVAGCFLGTDVTGTVNKRNVDGVFIESSNNIIGTNNIQDRNLIVGSFSTFDLNAIRQPFNAAVVIQTARNSVPNLASGNIIEGNLIGGVDRKGSALLDQCNIGILLFNTNDNTIRNNQIAGNGLYGILIVAMPYQVAGLRTTGPFESVGNSIEQNVIGTNCSGTKGVPNGIGIALLGTNVTDNIIGGSCENANLISANRLHGIQVGVAQLNTPFTATLFTGSPSNNIVSWNLIGVDGSGKKALGNGKKTPIKGLAGHGIFVGGAISTLINNNVISSNYGDGIFIAWGAQETVVASNIIGSDFHHHKKLGNRLNGIRLAGVTDGVVSSGLGGNSTTIPPIPTSNNVIGGNEAAGNFIAYNGKAGVAIESNAEQTTVSYNTFKKNGKAIKLKCEGEGNEIFSNKK